MIGEKMTDLEEKNSKHVRIFIIGSGDGFVNQQATEGFFASTLENYAVRFNSMVNCLRVSIAEILNESPTEFMSLDDLKYAARKSLMEQNHDIASEELIELIDFFNKNHYIYIRRGRVGGAQMFENAIHIVARSTAGNKEITSEFLEEVRQTLLSNE